MKQNDWSELLVVLAELRQQAPDVRFGQLIVNLATLARNPEPESVWDVDDAELLEAIRKALVCVKFMDGGVWNYTQPQG